MIDYEQYLVDVPRIFVYVNYKKFNDTPIELVNVLKRMYKRHYKYAANLCTQQTLSYHFVFFRDYFIDTQLQLVDGGKEQIHFNNDHDIKIYKPFNLIDIYKETIDYTIYLRIECNPQTRSCKSFWKMVEFGVDINFDKEWLIIMRDENTD